MAAARRHVAPFGRLKTDLERADTPDGAAGQAAGNGLATTPWRDPSGAAPRYETRWETDVNAPLDDLLRRAVEASASDIHLKVGSPPTMRIDGELRRMEDQDVLKPADIESYSASILTQKAANDLKDTNEADFAFGRPDIGRFRVSVYRQRGSLTMILRRVVPGVPSLDRLGLPPIVRRLASEERGLVLVTGPSGSGRSTTIAGIIDHINSTRPVSIVTIEDPIEVLFPDKMGFVAQREVGVDTADRAEAVIRATRHDADVIMISEIADTATAAAAVAAAETGHLVVGAMHTSDPGDTISRLIDFFPPDRQPTAHVQVANHLRGIISQRLVDSGDGLGRVLAAEVLVGNARLRELILADAPTDAIVDLVRESEFFGMQTFDQAFLALCTSRRVSVATALPHVRNPHELRAKLLEAGIDA